MNRQLHKLFSAFLLVPVAVLFLSCCCLKADASTHEKSRCASCPKKETSDHQTECPHAKIKAVVDADSSALYVAKTFVISPVLINLEQAPAPRFTERIALQQLDTSQHHPSLYSLNPILRV